MSEWQEYTLGDIVDIKHGYAFKGEFFSETPTTDILVTPGNFKIGGGFKSDKLKYYNGEIPDGFVLSHEDIIVTMTDLSKQADTLGYSAKVPIDSSKVFLHNQRIGLLIFKDKSFDKDFIYWLMRAEHYQKFVAGSATGATVKHSSPSRIRAFKFKAPTSNSLRKKIAKILSNYDDLIENNLKRIKLLEESARLTYEEWFLRFRVDGKRLEINPESGLPFGWENKSVTECDTFKQDKRKVKEFEGEKKYYATANISETEIIADGEIISWDSKPSRAQIKPNNNTVWFARMSNTYKVLCFNKKNINLQDNSVLSSGFAGFKAKNDLCLPFLYFTINSTFFHELKDLYATGATQVSLNNDSMSFIKIIEPSANLAEEFGSRTLPLIEEISILRSKNQLLKEARNILLPRLMTGMIDTNDMSIAV